MDPASCGADLARSAIQLLYALYTGWARVASCAANRKRHGNGGDTDGEDHAQARAARREKDHDAGRRGVCRLLARPPSTAVHRSGSSSSDPLSTFM
jgi:hypothetical protein